jgi:glycosyltransferase involved in cell wall biosynthesis
MKPSLALVIPVHNDEGNLIRLLHQAQELDVFDQIVICDDGSAVPIPAEVAPRALMSRLSLLRNERSQGAGAARNRAQTAVSTSHLLFADSDDLLTPEIGYLWQELEQEDFDFCLFRHHDSRNDAFHIHGQLAEDNRFWRRAGMGGCALTHLSADMRVVLAETANYPWNKIYRTDFLRDHSLGCSEMPVHEDVALHWLSFLMAQRVFASDRVGAVHFVHADGARLSNRRDAARLDAFSEFERVAQKICAKQGDEGPLNLAFLRFISGLAVWMRANLQVNLHQRLNEMIAQFLRAYLTPKAFGDLLGQSPDVALRMLFQLNAMHPDDALSVPFAPSQGDSPLHRSRRIKATDFTADAFMQAYHKVIAA